MLGEGRGDHLRRVERVIAEEDHHVVDRRVEDRQRDRRGMPGSQLFPLDDEGEFRVARRGVGAQLLGIFRADDEDGLDRVAPAGGGQGGVEDRATGDRVEHLGESRAHPGAPPGGEDDRGAAARLPLG